MEQRSRTGTSAATVTRELELELGAGAHTVSRAVAARPRTARCSKALSLGAGFGEMSGALSSAQRTLGAAALAAPPSAAADDASAWECSVAAAVARLGCALVRARLAAPRL